MNHGMQCPPVGDGMLRFSSKCNQRRFPAGISTPALEAITAGGATGATTCTKPGHPRCAQPYLAGVQPLRATLSPVDGGCGSGDKGLESGEKNHEIGRTALAPAASAFALRKARVTEAFLGPLQACEGGHRKSATRKANNFAPPPSFLLNPARAVFVPRPLGDGLLAIGILYRDKIVFPQGLEIPNLRQRDHLVEQPVGLLLRHVASGSIELMRKEPDRISFCYLDHKASRFSVGLAGESPLIETATL
jgi:hypothetical protein